MLQNDTQVFYDYASSSVHYFASREDRENVLLRSYSNSYNLARCTVNYIVNDGGEKISCMC